MWCSNCQQDTPGVANPTSGQIACSRCQQPTQQRKSAYAARVCDEGLALDLNGDAGLVATTIGAIFGVASVQNAHYVGVGLQLLEQGATYEALMQLALDARLGANASHKAVVDLLYTNVIGVAPTAAQEAPFVALLDSGQYTPAALGILAAQQPQNLAGVNIEFWSKVGLPFEWLS